MTATVSADPGLLYAVPMPVESKRMDGGTAVLVLSGRLVLGRELEQIDTTVQSLLALGDRRFILDATALEYMDSAAIGALVSSLSKVKKAGGELRLAGANARILRVFSITGVDRLIPSFATVAEAAAG
jgi:anti-sigma B factor antagonist